MSTATVTAAIVAKLQASPASARSTPPALRPLAGRVARTHAAGLGRPGQRLDRPPPGHPRKPGQRQYLAPGSRVRNHRGHGHRRTTPTAPPPSRLCRRGRREAANRSHRGGTCIDAGPADVEEVDDTPLDEADPHTVYHVARIGFACAERVHSP